MSVSGVFLNPITLIKYTSVLLCLLFLTVPHDCDMDFISKVYSKNE